MMPDELGFLRPHVDTATCLNCGLCYKNCVINNPEPLRLPLNTYGAVRHERDKVRLSSSGGVFAAIAEHMIERENWCVVGSILDESISAVHVITDTVSGLLPMYGSKYVQSEMRDVYKAIRMRLGRGESVLFSGTPCQVAAIQRYSKYHPNLYTVEVICHGVPNNAMFNSYLNQYDRGTISQFIFRDKGQGWSFNNKIVYKNGRVKKVNHRLSSYMTYFLKGEIYRDSCYKCPYATEKRCADITIGDFWGIMQTRPDIDGVVDVEKGVSCLLVNTEKGAELVKNSQVDLYDVPYQAIKDGNGPVNEPSKHTDKREIILNIWRKNHDWKEVHHYWKANDFNRSFYIWALVPPALQHKIRLMLKKR